MKKKIFIFAVLISALAFVFSFLFLARGKYFGIGKATYAFEKRKRAWLDLQSSLTQRVRNFNGTVGLVIEDLDTGWRIALNANEPIASASLVKVPVMLSCYYAAEESKIKLRDTMRLKASYKVGGSKVLGNEPNGAVFTVKELFCPMITESDNAAANMVIDFMGFDALNAYFRRIGLSGTNIKRKMMDFRQRRDGEENYTTAGDMAYIFELLYRGRFLNRTISKECLDLLAGQKINDRIPKRLPAGVRCAHKTGLESHVCHDAGIVYTDKGNFLICVLVRHEDKFAKPAKNLISDIALQTYNYFQGL